jgi:DNA-directed RNA polymerase subunit K/omega
MELDRTRDIEKAFRNRYEAVLKIAKYARKLNMERLHDKTEGEEGETPQVEEKTVKMVAQALKDTLEGKVEFEKS